VICELRKKTVKNFLLKSSKTKFSLEDKKTKKDLFAFDAVF
jgi:hypothetical protein